MLGLTIFKRALPGNLRQVQTSESALRVIFMVLHKVSNFTKKAVTDVNLPGARERGVLHRFDRGLLWLNVRRKASLERSSKKLQDIASNGAIH